jgi:hypothetical protein
MEQGRRDSRQDEPQDRREHNGFHNQAGTGVEAGIFQESEAPLDFGFDMVQ